MTAITDKKNARQVDERNNIRTEKDGRVDRSDHLREEEQEKHDPGGTNFGKKKQVIKEKPIQRLERFGLRPKTRPIGNRPCKLCGVSNWTPLHRCQATETNCNKCGKRGHYAKVCGQKYTNNRTVRRLTKEEPDDRSETSSESNESIHHTKEIKKIEEKHKNHEATVTINGKKKEYCITDNNNATGRRNSKINRNTKITNKYQDVNENEVKFRRKIPLNLKYENEEQKMGIR